MSRGVGQYRANMPLIGAKIGGLIRRILDRIRSQSIMMSARVFVHRIDILLIIDYSKGRILQKSALFRRVINELKPKYITCWYHIYWLKIITVPGDVQTCNPVFF